MPSITELSHLEARRYFFEHTNYVSFDLPPYFDFTEILTKTAQYMGERGVHEFFETTLVNGKPGKLNPADFEGVNYKLISNKDGEFAWRPFEIIHPALYVSLVNELTQAASWSEIVDRFALFKKSAIKCESMPYVSDDNEKHKAHQVKNWWTNVEQASLKAGLDYQYVFDVDIADCYGAIYTHSISWALHGKELMKQNRGKMFYLGNRIDALIQKMRYRQTNGIPQGSAVMDFIAEIILGDIDLRLTERLDDLKVGREGYQIIRFRDDYKIFSNNPEIGRMIVKELSSILSGQSMKLNTSKTKMQADPIVASIKPDKLYELFVPKNNISMSKRLLLIYECSNQYPNSGLVTRQMNDYYRDLQKMKKLGKYDDARVMISIISNLAIKNPRTYQWSMAILSHLLSHFDIQEIPQIVNDIRSKFEVVPNAGILDIWLQRVSYKIDPTIIYDEKLTRIASGDYITNLIWKSDWLEPGLRKVILDTSIVVRKIRDEAPMVITPQEVALFNYPYWD